MPRCGGAAGFMVRRECGACGYGLGLACLVLGNRLAGRSGQDGLQICCGGFGQLVDARLADRVEEAAVFADVTDRLGPPRLVGQVLQDLAGSGPWGGISVPSTPGTTSMAQVGAKTGRDRAGLRFPGAVPGPRRPDDLLVAHADRVLQVAGLHSGPAGSWAGSCAGSPDSTARRPLTSLPGHCTEYALARGRALPPGSGIPDPPESAA